MQLNYLRMILKGVMLLVGYVVAKPGPSPTLGQVEVVERLSTHIKEWNEDCRRLTDIDRYR